MSRATGMAAWLTGCDSMAGDAQRARRGRLHAVQGLRGGDYGHAAVLIRLCHRALRLHVHVLLAGQLISAKQKMTKVNVLHMQITYVPCSWGCKSPRIQLVAKGHGELLCNTQQLALMQIPAGVQICNWTRTGRRWKGAPFQCQPHLHISPPDRADGNMCWHGNWQHLAAVMESGDSAMTLSASPMRMSVSWLFEPGGV